VVEDTCAVRLSLQRKIAGGYGLLLILIIALGWVTLSLFNSLRTVQRSVFNSAVPGLVVVDEIVRSYTAQSAAVRGYLINTQPELLAQYDAEVEQVRGRQAEAKKLFVSGRERELLDEIVDAGREFQDVVDKRVIPLAEAGNRALAQNALASQGDPLIAEIESLGAELRAAQDDLVAQSEDDLSSRSNQTILILILVLLGALAVGAMVAFALPRRLGRNIAKLVDAARAIGRGDLDQRVRIKSKDEVEELATRFTEMQSGLKKLQQLALQERELEIAASIQNNLLQRAFPEIPGVRILPVLRQANRVGGDWYDIDVVGGLLSVAVGDASGKGIAAALMATVTLSVLRAERGLGADTRRIIGRANEALKDATDPESFTTLVYCTVDYRTGEARWLNMGHPSPFLLRRKQDEEGGLQGYFVDGPTNKTLGWFDDPGLEETTFHMQPGDRLIFYTDGFLDAKSAEGQVFGEDRFAHALLRLGPLAVANLSEEVIREVERYAAGKLDDDLTMIIVEFMGAPLGDRADRRLTGEEPWHSRR
jgi:serine phosphatase RsbU (regulator of sigma subunit)/CHASE3 domain sensor protein